MLRFGTAYARCALHARARCGRLRAAGKGRRCLCHFAALHHRHPCSFARAPQWLPACRTERLHLCCCVYVHNRCRAPRTVLTVLRGRGAGAAAGGPACAQQRGVCEVTVPGGDGPDLVLETGRIAKLADGAVLAT